MSEPQSSTSAPGQPPAVLVAAIRKILRPMVRLMLSYQITYPFVVNLLKSIYVEVADKEFKVTGKVQTDSRINLLTGVHRKDVKRLRAEVAETTSMPRNISIGAQLIAYWLGSDEFLDAEGKPLALPLRSAANQTDIKTFDALVEVVCKQDIRPRVILDQWLHMGIAQLDNQGRVTLNTGAFTPAKGFEEKAFFFGKNIHDHLAASTQNLIRQTPSYFDRSVYYDNLTLESINELSELAGRTGMNALTTINKTALALQKRDQSRNQHTYRMNFGIFNFNTPLNTDKTVDKDANDA